MGLRNERTRWTKGPPHEPGVPPAILHADCHVPQPMAARKTYGWPAKHGVALGSSPRPCSEMAYSDCLLAVWNGRYQPLTPEGVPEFLRDGGDNFRDGIYSLPANLHTSPGFNHKRDARRDTEMDNTHR